MYLKRAISQIIDQELSRDDNKVLLIVGQRRAGKTSELVRLQKNFPKTQYFDFEDISNRYLFSPSVKHLESLIGSKQNSRLLLLDEIQFLPKAGSILKLIHDHFANTKIVATGSASFLMLKNIGDSLYGRYIPFNMYPLSFREMIGDADNFDFKLGKYGKLINQAAVSAQLRNVMIYGSLPEVFIEEDKKRKKMILKNYINSLLFKDIFEIEGIRNPSVFIKLLKLLALQISSEINPNELAQKLEISRKTVLEYINLYEKFQIIYRLNSYSNNPRREITKGFKIYFADLGIRNAVIDNFILTENRSDTGSLFENLVMNVSMQNIEYFKLSYQMYFWRTFTKAEVDLVLVDTDLGELIPIEIKYSKTKKPSRSFFGIYEDKIKQQYYINKDNLWKFI